MIWSEKLVAAAAVFVAVMCGGSRDARAVLLHGQTGGQLGDSASQDFEALYDTSDCQGADDIVVPAGLSWSVESVTAHGYYFSSTGPAGLMPAVNVLFYSDATGTPGAPNAACTYTNVVPTADAAGDITVTLPTACVLPAGKHWVSVQAVMSYTTSGQWYWQRVTTSVGSLGSWRNPGDGLGSGCTDWAPVSVCLTNMPGGPDWAFRIDGTIVATCGNGAIEAGEACDDGNVLSCDGCRLDCSAVETGCGDGFQCNAETCDDGNVVNGDGCDENCTVSACGNGAVAPTEVCDDANTVDCDGCRGDCSAAETGCGDGFLCGREECDDGNATSRDGCSSCELDGEGGGGGGAGEGGAADGGSAQGGSSSGGSPSAGGGPSTGGAAVGGDGTGGAAPDEGGAGADDDGGCNCLAAGSFGGSGKGSMLVIALAALACSRRRRRAG